MFRSWRALALLALLVGASPAIAQSKLGPPPPGLWAETKRVWDSAASDDGAALYELGNMHRYGRGGIRKSEQDAVWIYRMAAERNNADAIFTLAQIADFGWLGQSKDRIEAMRLYRKAADAGSARAQNRLAGYYRRGVRALGIERDVRETVRYYRMSSQQGDRFGTYEYARLHERGEGVRKDLVEAARLYRLAADQNHFSSNYRLGQMYERGVGGLPRDREKAIQHYLRSRFLRSDNGARALKRLGVRVANPDLGPEPQNLSRFWRRYWTEAVAGDVFSIHRIAEQYNVGRNGFERSKREAGRLWRLAAKKGYAPAQARLGRMYEIGRGGVPKDEMEAVRLFRLAAAQSNTEGMFNLARMYRNGRGGLAKSDVEAVKLYRRATELRHAAAPAMMGLLHERGVGGLVKSDAEAVKFYRLAIKRGSTAGNTNMAYMYEQGRGGLQKNVTEAIRLYRIAARKGSKWSRKQLERLGVQ